MWRIVWRLYRCAVRAVASHVLSSFIPACGADGASAFILDGPLTFLACCCCTFDCCWLSGHDSRLLFVASVAVIAHTSLVIILCGAVYCGMCQEACPVGTFAFWGLFAATLFIALCFSRGTVCLCGRPLQR